jgi:transposase, IS5 family
VEPHYPKAGNGRPPVGVERMLRIYFLQQWFNLSDPAVEEALYDSAVMRRLPQSCKQTAKSFILTALCR